MRGVSGDLLAWTDYLSGSDSRISYGVQAAVEAGVWVPAESRAESSVKPTMRALLVGDK